ncbi:MAG: endolytic transglycosylase MltG [Candidatus Desulforudis sp.]|nr:endolytic transglycosylase MltG [Desulforudis sp.]
MIFQQRIVQGPLQIIMGIVGLTAFIIGVAGVCLNVVLAPVAARETPPVVVEIPPNVSTAQIAKILADRDLVRNPVAFRLYTRLAGLDGALKAGEYEVSPHLSTPEIVEFLVQGRVRLSAFNVPEGLNVDQTIKVLVERGLGDQETFAGVLREIAATHLLGYPQPTGQYSLEGYLYPDTYLVAPGAGEGEIVRFMLSRFEEEVERLDLTTRADEYGLTLHEAVTLASLIEREARVAEERRVISGVIHNRLERGMLLQVCATVIYALGDCSREVVLEADLEVDSPYNTYLHPGLPPGPIASPGRDSLLAAVDPEEHDYLYYVVKPDGSHAFSRTLAEHNANKRLYLP